jgi:hypothetical protein
MNRARGDCIDAQAALPYKPHATANGDSAREADLSTQQAGAQAPSRVSCPPQDHGRPQGDRGPQGARAQAAQRLTLRRACHAAAQAARGLPGRREWREGFRNRIRAAGAQSAQGWTGARGIYRFEEGRHGGRAQPRAPAPAGNGPARSARPDAAGLRLCADRAQGCDRHALRSAGWTISTARCAACMRAAPSKAGTRAGSAGGTPAATPHAAEPIERRP